jgi:hypothetical protein
VCPYGDFLGSYLLLDLLMNCNFLLYSYYKRLVFLSQPAKLVGGYPTGCP